jgi:uncharacterized protein
MRVLSVILPMLAVYAAWCALLFLAQDWLVFPGTGLGAPAAAPPGGTEVEWLEHPDGAKTEVWLAMPEAAEGPVPWVVYLHGNAELIDHQAEVIHRLRSAGWAVALPEYRGYGRSEGRPGQRAITADLIRAVDALAVHPALDAERVVYFGRSIGAGFAAQLAHERPPAAMILQSPFLRTDRMALRYLAPPFLVRHSFRTDRILPHFDRPVLIIEHGRDEIVPAGHARALHDMAPDSTLVVLDAGHNDSGSPADQARERAAIVALLGRVAEP